MAKGTRGETKLVREVRPYTRVWADPSMGSSRPTRGFAAAIVEKAPYALKIVPERASVPQTGKVELKIEATRYWPELKAPIRLIGLGLPGGFQFAETEIAADAPSKTCTLEIQNVRPGTYTLTLLGQAQTPFNKDPAAKEAPNTLVSIPSQPVTIEVTAPKK